MIHGDFPDWITEGGLDSVTQYELWKAIWSSLNDGNFFELAWALERHQQFCQTFAPLTFVGNHDVTRIASKLTDARQARRMRSCCCSRCPACRSSTTATSRAFAAVKEDREGGDDAVRPAFPADPAGLPADGWPVYRLHQKLIGLRRRESWLVTGSVEQLTLANEQFSYRITGKAGESLVVLLNISDQEFDFPVDGEPMAVAEAGPDGSTITAGNKSFRVGAFSWAVLRPVG